MASNSVPAATATTQNRLRVFADSFKAYMSVMPIVTAALAPILTFLKAIPMYESERTTLATLSGILGFLLLAWLFYVRRTIALGSLIKGFRFLINMTPFLLIVGTLAAYLGYSQLLQQSLDSALDQAQKGQWTYTVADRIVEYKTRSDVLHHWTDRSIPSAVPLQLLYLLIFLASECAFVLMALREYINDTRGVSEGGWMFGKQDVQTLQKIQEDFEARQQDQTRSPS
jgi:hypothetical protein